MWTPLSPVTSSGAAAKRLNWTAFLVALAVPVGVMGIFFALNRGYPTGDAGDFAYTGMVSFRHYKSFGFLSALVDAYWHRRWKPVFHPVLLLLALILTGGNLRLSVALINLPLFILMMIYVFKLARGFLPLHYAVVTSWFIGTLPWVLMSAGVFTCELPYLASGMAALYYLFKCDYFRSLRNSVFLGVALGASLLFQPFLSAMNFGIGMLIFSLHAMLTRILKLKDIVFALSNIALAGLLFEWQYRYGLERSFQAFLLCAALVLMLMVYWGASIRKWQLSRPFYWAFVVFFSTFFLWCGPFQKKFYDWLEATTFSVGAHFYNNPEEGPLFFHRLFKAFGGNYLIFVIAFAVLGWIMNRLFSQQGGPRKAGLVFLGAFTLIAPSIGSLTQNPDPRYYYLGFTLLFLTASINILSIRDGLIQRFMKRVFLMTIAGSVFLSLVVFYNPKTSLADQTQKIIDYGIYVRKGLRRTAEPAAQFVDHFCGVARLSRDRHYEITQLLNGFSLSQPDPWEISVVLQERGYDVTVSRPWMLTSLPENQLPLETVKQYYDLIILGLTPNENRLSFDLLGYRTAADLFYIVRKGKTADNGLTIVSEFGINNPDEKFLILKTPRFETQ